MENNNVDNGAKNPGEAQAPPQQPGPQNQYNYGYNAPYYPPMPPSRRKSDKPRMAGGILTAVGILGLIMAIMMVVGGAFIGSADNFDIEDWGQVDITGIVLAADGSPIDNATLTVEGTHIAVTTNSAGYYQMLGVPAGYNQITLEKAGYNTIIRHVYIVPDDSSADFNFANHPVIFEDSELNFNMTVGSDTFTYGQDGESFPIEKMGPFLMVLGVVFALCSIAALIGGHYALKSEKYSITIVCAIIGIFSVGFMLGTILAIAALVILLLSSEEFKKNGNGQV
jgi:hypothetical protein